MTSVKEVLDKKGYDIYSIAPNASVFDAIELMSQKEVGALIVLEDDKLAGIISERDYTRKVILKGKSSKKTMIRTIMTTPVIYTKADQDIKKCMAIMTSKSIRHLPVMEDDQLIGMVSLGDLVKVIISQQDSKIHDLENYFRYRSDLL